MTPSADVVIIGGGIHGAALAYHLSKARAGTVVLIEKNRLASGPTGHSGAMVRPLFIDKTYVDLVLRSTTMFENWSDEIGGDAGFVKNGFLRITASLDQAVINADLSLVTAAGESYSILDADRISEMVPAGTFASGEKGILLPRAGFADPLLSTIQLARAAERHGARLMENTTVESIESRDGRIRAVVTDHGRIDTRIVVNCAGCWAPRVAKMVGVDLPISVQRTPTCLFRRPEPIAPGGPVLSDGVNRIYLRTLGDALVRAAHFGWTADPADPDHYDETVNAAQVGQFRKSLNDRYAAMRHSTFFGGFSALYDMTSDGHPLVGPCPGVEGFWLNCGWSGNGFASAPAMGRCLAQLIMHQPSDVDLSLFKYPRASSVQERADMRWVNR